MTYLRLFVIAIIAFGAYTLGARAGHGRNPSIKKNAKKAWTAPAIRAARKKARKTTRNGGRKITRALTK